MKKKKKDLRIDPEFRDLIQPLLPDERKQLELNLVADGCREPICIWNGYILDGHNRYELCRKHNIPYETIEIRLSCRAEAMSWICANQLGRRNIGEETRKYLIGKRYEAEKMVNPNQEGTNQHSVQKEVDPKMLAQPQNERQRAVKRTSVLLGKEYHISHGTVEKYWQYARAIDEIKRKNEAIAEGLLSGQIRLSHENTVELSKMSKQKIERIEEAFTDPQKPAITFKTARNTLIEVAKKPHIEYKMGQDTVKSMPGYDPDAEISSLTLTIPSWGSSITRVVNNTKWSETTTKARVKLQRELVFMKEKIEEIQKKMMENSYE